MPVAEMHTQTLYGFAEASKRWGVSADTLRRAAATGDLKTVCIVGRRLIHIDELQRVERSGLGRGRKQRAK